MRAIKLYTSKIADAILEGAKKRQNNIEGFQSETTQEVPVDRALVEKNLEAADETKEISVEELQKEAKGRAASFEKPESKKKEEPKE